MKKRLIQVGYILAFLAVCAGLLQFLSHFTQSDPIVYLTWESGTVVSAQGEETDFDPASSLPSLESGEHYRFTLRLPDDRENGFYLIVWTTGLEATILLAGAELWYSVSKEPEEAANLSLSEIPLPAGGSETLTMEVRPLSDRSLLPPLLQLTTDPTDQAGTIAYANYYGLPAGASALALALLWGLFLLGASQGKRNWTLLLPAFAAAALTLQRLTSGYGAYFLHPDLLNLLSSRWLEWLSLLALVLFLVLQRGRTFWKALGLITAWSAGALTVLGLISRLRGGYLSRRLESLISELDAGIWSGTLYWLIWWLVLVCATLSAWELARSLAQAKSEAQALTLKNRLVMDNYRSMDKKLRETAQLRHEFAHQIIALNSMIQARDWDGLDQWMAVWHQDSVNRSIRYTENITVNAILQDADERARKAGISFHVSVLLPQALSVSDEDLCALLMNMLDNALEGAGRTPEGQEKSIRFRMRVSGNFLPIHCENSFDGHVETDGRGVIRTTKADPSAHGFGLAQMRTVAEKYGSILEVNWTEDRFTVQTALQIRN